MFASDEYHKIKIVSNAWENHNLQFQCPLNWNINQIKCYITHVYPRMQFNLFELTLGGRLMDPKQKLQKILENRKSNQNIVFFIILRQSMKFQDYYAERMKQFEQAIQQQYYDILGCKQQASLTYLPILNNKFQDFLKIQSGIKKLNPQPVLPNPNNVNIAPVPVNEVQNNNGFGIMNLLRMVLFYTVIILIYYHGTFQQASIIFLVALLHYMVGNGVIARQNNLNLNLDNNNVQAANNNNTEINNDEQKKQLVKQQKKKRRKVLKKQNKLKKIVYSLLQILYCYSISLFPNWNVEDYLQKYKNIIQMRRSEVQQQVIYQYDQVETKNQNQPEQFIKNKED